MTRRETKWMLESVRRINLRILEQEHIIKSLQENLQTSDLAAIQYDKDRVQSSPADPSDKIIRSLELILRHSHMVDKLKDDKIDLIVTLTSAISKIEDDRERLILTGHYIDGEAVEDIADEIPCARASAYRYRDNGIDNLSRLLP